METLVPDDSPLAAYLEGKGEADLVEHDAPLHYDDSSSQQEHFAPNGLPSFVTKIASRPTLQRMRSGPLSTIRNVYAYAVTSTLGSADNDHFLEHFRYIIIASQLLSDHTGAASSKSDTKGPSTHPDGLSITGVVISAVSAFALVWVLDWARDSPSGDFNARRLSFVAALFVVAGILLYAFIRRQWLKYLRRQAIESATSFVESVHSYENVTSSVLTLIQEVELVSRGYRISNPLPPVSRLESKGQSRKCSRLRAHLSSVYAAAIPAFTVAVEKLRPQLNENDLDRFLEVYDIREEDMLEAFLGISDGDSEERGSLKQLRVHQHRLSLLRRIMLCSLLSIPATGRKIDAVRWRMAVSQMEGLGSLLNDLTEKTSKMVDEEEHMPKALNLSRSNTTSAIPSPTTSAQMRRISALSSGIRSLQAKLYLLREDSTRSLSASPSESDLARLSLSLRDQYESIGGDIRTLMQAWESGRQALIEDISKQERRMSLTSSSGGRFSHPSISGLTAVDEDEAAPTMSPRSSALQRLTGTSTPLPLSPPVTESESEGGKDDEVFEAVAEPRPRSTMTREERIAKMQEDRDRQAAVREKREASTNMIRELQSVIRLRPGTGPSDGAESPTRVTSV